MLFLRYHKDRTLLRDCDRGEKEAIEKFNNLSYMNAIRATIRRVTEEAIDDPDEIEALAVLSAAEIYSLYNKVPSHTRELRARIRGAAQNFATDYLHWKYR